ncbi:hypothetical protein ANO11243_071130 [Dothideomycetidae sp. 11243]|nr:hypothetical protein ANO11243_071130 [fungal sp. No.11243]
MSPSSSSSLTAFFARSRDFHSRHSRPISSSTTLERLVTAGQITRDDARRYVNSTRIIVHPEVRRLAGHFLAHKRVHGTVVERQVYAAHLGWNVDSLILRLVEKRPLSFLGKRDTTLLRSGMTTADAAHAWDRVGGSHEKHPLTMDRYLTYEEMMLSSLIGVSGYTPYFNDGDRHNKGVRGVPGSFQREGVQVGLVGARFERRGRMDSTYAFSPTGNLPPAQFFPFALYFPGKDFEQRYKARMRITVETLLLEAQMRGHEANKRVYLHVVGLGLGVWAVHKDQRKWFLQVFARCLAQLKPSGIAILELGHMDGDPAAKRNVEIEAYDCRARCVFNRRPPSARLPYDEFLLITTYAWDSNSYPGNDFYMGMLDASGDPAAACSSAIAETQNPEINKNMLRGFVELRR